MSEALFAIGRAGKRTLETLIEEPVELERKLPGQLLHSSAINDLRIGCELTGRLEYFYGAWELPRLGWKHPIIPDGLAAFDGKIFAIEFDSGAEGIRFFVQSKMTHYARGLTGVPVTAVLVVVDRLPRLTALAKAISNRHSKTLLTTLELARGHSFLAPIWYEEGRGWGATPLESVSCQSVLPTRDLPLDKASEMNELPKSDVCLLRQRGV
jgi:hypothetical protein